MNTTTSKPKRLIDYHRAGFSALWCSTLEPDRAVTEYTAEIVADGSAAYTWDILRGICDATNHRAMNAAAGDPAALVAWLAMQNNDDNGFVVFALNLHRFVGAIEVIQALHNYAPVMKNHRAMLVALVPPGTQIPAELDRSFALLTHELPTREQLNSRLDALRQGNTGLEDFDDATRAKLLDAAAGLTSGEAESAFALSAAMHNGVLRPDVVADEKAMQVRKSASLELGRYPETFASLGGLENLKTFCARAIKSQDARGVLLLGVPGTGKSAFAKALGNEAELPTLSLDFGRLFGGIVGESESKTRAALAVVGAMAPCVLFIDEIEKGLAGAGSSGATDSGVTARVTGTFLTWLNDRPAGIFVVGTCNNVMALPPEFLRAERWDALFFVNLPTVEERAAIYAIHAAAYGIGPQHGELPDLADWTGAEIKTLCRLTRMLGSSLEEAARYVVPVARARAEDITRLREWAKDRAVPASLSPPSRVESHEDLAPRIRNIKTVKTGRLN